MNRAQKWDCRRTVLALPDLLPLIIAILIGIGILWHSRFSGPVEPFVGMSFDIAPVGHKLIFNGNGRGGSDLYLLDLQTWKVTRLTDTPTAERYPVFTPDGQAIVYAESKAQHKECYIMTYALSTGKTHQLTHPEPPYSDSMPGCSRDGTHIAFMRAALTPVIGFGGAGSDGWDLYTMKRNGSDIRQVTTNRYINVSAPAYSAKDRTLLFCGYTVGSPDGTSHLYSVPVDGSSPPVMLDPTPCWNPCLSPDGKHIAVISDKEKEFAYDVLLMHSNGKYVRSLSITGYSTYNQCPRFTEDGKRIFYIGGPISHDTLLSSVTKDGSQFEEEATGELFQKPLQWKSRQNPMHKY